MNNTGLKILFIEDNPHDAELINRVLKKNNSFISVQSLAYAKSLSEGAAILEKDAKDAILLDLNLPDGRGVALLEQILNKAPHTPVVVLTGDNNPQMALAALDAGAMDCLIKDELSGDMLGRSLRFALERHKKLKDPMHVSGDVREKIRQDSVHFDSNLFIKSGSKYVSISFSDIHFIEATGDYVLIHSTSGKYIAHSTMNVIETKLDPSLFARVHRSYIVNLSKINNIRENQLTIGGDIIPIGRTYKADFMKRIKTL